MDLGRFEAIFSSIELFGEEINVRPSGSKVCQKTVFQFTLKNVYKNRAEQALSPSKFFSQ